MYSSDTVPKYYETQANIWYSDKKTTYYNDKDDEYTWETVLNYNKSYYTVNPMPIHGEERTYYTLTIRYQYLWSSREREDGGLKDINIIQQRIQNVELTYNLLANSAIGRAARGLGKTLEEITPPVDSSYRTRE